MGIKLINFYINMLGIAPKLQAMSMRMTFLPKTILNFFAHPAGPYTIFFWAPTFKWMITFANVGDMKKPAENISVNQQIAIFATGAIWSRYSMVITPVNYNLMIVDIFMGASAGVQLFRKY